MYKRQQQRGLPATGRSEYCNKLSLFHVQSHIIQCCFLAKILRDMAHLNDCLLYTSHFDVLDSCLHHFEEYLRFSKAIGNQGLETLSTYIYACLLYTSFTFFPIVCLGVFFNFKPKAMLSYTFKCGNRAYF